MKYSIRLFLFLLFIPSFLQGSWTSGFSVMRRTLRSCAAQYISKKFDNVFCLSPQRHASNKKIYPHLATVFAFVGHSFSNTSRCEVHSQVGREQGVQAEIDRKLLFAANNGDRKSFTRLLASGANPNAVVFYNDIKLTPLDWAVENDDGFMVNMLLRNGAQYEPNSLLLRAAVQGKVKAFEELFEHSHNDCDKNTLLVAAARGGNLKIVKYLYERGADINGGGRNSSSLVEAVKNGHLDTVRYLCFSGADPNAKDMMSYGKVSALEIAYCNGYNDIFDVLSDAGAKPSERLQAKMREEVVLKAGGSLGVVLAIMIAFFR